jgi:hypothetical protein
VKIFKVCCPVISATKAILLPHPILRIVLWWLPLAVQSQAGNMTDTPSQGVREPSESNGTLFQNDGTRRMLQTFITKFDFTTGCIARGREWVIS